MLHCATSLGARMWWQRWWGSYIFCFCCWSWALSILRILIRVLYLYYYQRTHLTRRNYQCLTWRALQGNRRAQMTFPMIVGQLFCNLLAQQKSSATSEGFPNVILKSMMIGWSVNQPIIICINLWLGTNIKMHNGSWLIQALSSLGLLFPLILMNSSIPFFVSLNVGNKPLYGVHGLMEENLFPFHFNLETHMGYLYSVSMNLRIPSCGLYHFGTMVFIVAAAGWFGFEITMLFMICIIYWRKNTGLMIV